jgi:hypothetical protein
MIQMISLPFVFFSGCVILIVSVLFCTGENEIIRNTLGPFICDKHDPLLKDEL